MNLEDYNKKIRYKNYISIILSLLLFITCGAGITLLSYLLCG